MLQHLHHCVGGHLGTVHDTVVLALLRELHQRIAQLQGLQSQLRHAVGVEPHVGVDAVKFNPELVEEVLSRVESDQQAAEAVEGDAPALHDLVSDVPETAEEGVELAAGLGLRCVPHLQQGRGKRHRNSVRLEYARRRVVNILLLHHRCFLSSSLFFFFSLSLSNACFTPITISRVGSNSVSSWSWFLCHWGYVLGSRVRGRIRVCNAFFCLTIPYRCWVFCCPFLYYYCFCSSFFLCDCCFELLFCPHYRWRSFRW
mmetsp:Transcript_6674/g.11222  ORF Transcript_6674/g.11222 Transcript_6674/m.11222 type:complete len:257 (+) Transcript_6674:2544-3314(+)